MKRMADAMNGEDSKRNDRNGSGRGKPSHVKRMCCGVPEKRCHAVEIACVTVKTLADEKETDLHRLAQRQKQIDYGKNTIGYDRYCAQVPRQERRRGKHPMTPDKTMRIGKKVFDGIVRKWRQALHKYDPPELVDVIKTMMVRDDAIETTTVDATLTNVTAGAAMKVTSVQLEEGTVSDVSQTTPQDSKSTLPSRSIYETFDEDKVDDDNDDSDDDNDSDDDLL